MPIAIMADNGSQANYIKGSYTTPISNSNPDLQSDRGWGWRCAQTRSNRFVQSFSLESLVCVMNEDKKVKTDFVQNYFSLSITFKNIFSIISNAFLRFL